MKSIESGITFDLWPLLKLREEALEEKLACDVKKFISSELGDGLGQGFVCGAMDS